MHLSISFPCTRFTRRGVEYDTVIEVSGEVTAGCSHLDCDCLYSVELDEGDYDWPLGEEGQLERTSAEERLGDLFLSKLPFVPKTVAA